MRPSAEAIPTMRRRSPSALFRSTLPFKPRSTPTLSWLVTAPSFRRMVAVELWFSFLFLFLFASYNGALIVFLTEIMPTEVRTAGFSLVHSSATAIFGGFTPAI